MKEKKIQAKDYYFNFEIEGVLNNDLIKKESIFSKLILVEIGTKIDCSFSQKADLNACLTCEFYSEHYKFGEVLILIVMEERIGFYTGPEVSKEYIPS